MTRVLVTGARGFIGRRTIPLLIEAGHQVHAATRGRPPAGGSVRWHQADLLAAGSAEDLIERSRPDRLLHLAWYTEQGKFWDAPENRDWVDAGLGLWRAFAAAGGERVLVAGSCAEYEWSSPVLAENSTPLRPATLYGACKDELRRLLESESADAGLSLAWGRIFFLYGPGEPRGSLVTSVADALLAGEPARTTEGSQLRDFLHVDDVAGALVAVLEGSLEGPVNIGSGEGTRVRDLVEAIGRLTGRRELLELGAIERPRDDPDSIVADVTRLRSELSWEPSIGLEAGLRDTVESLRG